MPCRRFLASRRRPCPFHVKPLLTKARLATRMNACHVQTSTLWQRRAPLEDSVAHKPGPLESAADVAPESPVGSSVSRETPARTVPRETDANGPSVAPVAPAWSHDDDRERSALAAELAADRRRHATGTPGRRGRSAQDHVVGQGLSEARHHPNPDGGKPEGRRRQDDHHRQRGRRAGPGGTPRPGDRHRPAGKRQHGPRYRPPRRGARIYDVLVDGMAAGRGGAGVPGHPRTSVCARHDRPGRCRDRAGVARGARDAHAKGLRRYIDGAAARGEDGSTTCSSTARPAWAC